MTADALGGLRATLRADYAVNDGTLTPKITLAVWRLGQAAHVTRSPLGFALRRVHSVLDALWVRGVIGAELPRSVPAGPGLRLPHGGRGVILHPRVTIGSGVTLYHQVTLGVRGGDTPPRLGDGVYVGAGAKVIGDLVVGAGSSLGANAVVLHDVPAGETWVGVPARSTRPVASPPERPGPG
jgi:serine O-acetyltransferase